jgi:hypothetical protein
VYYYLVLGFPTITYNGFLAHVYTAVTAQPHGLVTIFFSFIFHSKKNRNKPLWSQNRGVNNITIQIYILTTSTIVSLLFLSDQLVAIFCMTSKYNPWRAPGFTSGFFVRVRVAHLFSFFVLCYYVSLSSVLLCSLQFPHKNDIWFVFATGARGTGGGGGNSVPRAPVVFASSCLW